jgi:hypothetical protein
MSAQASMDSMESPPKMARTTTLQALLSLLESLKHTI